MEIWEFRQKQTLPYKAKIDHARRRAEEFYNEITINRNANVHVSIAYNDEAIVKEVAKLFDVKVDDE